MNHTYPTITLHAGKDQSIRRFHPWVFSGAIKNVSDTIKEGDVVEVYSSNNQFLGTGHYQKGSIAVRLFSFEKIIADKFFWKKKIEKAYELRTTLQLTHQTHTNVFRLVHGEGDEMPGLIMDFYNGTIVFQAHSIGMYLMKEIIIEALRDVMGDKLKAVYDKSKETLPVALSTDAENGLIYGKSENNTILENNNTFIVDWETGQKTGFFIDQRENRKLLSFYCKDKAVLNTFCYSGGFSVYAMNAGARLVHSVDSSKKAIELTDKNMLLNSPASEKHQSFVADTFTFLEKTNNEYDVIILDPPAFAKHQHTKHNAVKGYTRLNAEALRKINTGGILFTFSCSQAVDTSSFNSAVMAAAIKVGRKVKILHHLSQPADHPVNIFHPEGEYLKGLVLYIEK